MLYRQAGTLRRWGKVEFQLVGNNLQVRYSNVKFQNNATALTAAEQTNAYFTANGYSSTESISDVTLNYSLTGAVGPSLVLVDISTLRMGIGTTSPTQTLTVSGTAQITGALYDSSGDAGTAGQVLSSTSTSTDWVNANTLVAGGLIDADGDTQVQVEEGTDDDAIRFDTGGTQRAVITAAGNMGIGTTAPNAPLQLAKAAANRKLVLYETTNNDHQFYGLGINGGVLRYQVDNLSSNHIFYAATNATTSKELMRVKGSGVIQFSDYGAGSLSTDASGNLSVSSDERLKNIQGNFTKGLQAILALKPINYQWKEISGLEQEGTYSGFSAQNVQSVLPEAVGTDKKGYLTLSDRPLIAALVNAIKELSAEVEELKAEIKTLKQ